MTVSNNVIVVHTDGGSRGNPGPAAIGVQIELNGQTLFEKSASIGTTTNNTAEYTALLQALQWLVANLSKHHVSSIQFFLDSQLVVEQLNGKYKIKKPHILEFVRTIHQLVASLSIPVQFIHIPREQNARADVLVNEALDAPAFSR